MDWDSWCFEDCRKATATPGLVMIYTTQFIANSKLKKKRYKFWYVYILSH